MKVFFLPENGFIFSGGKDNDWDDLGHMDM